MANRGSEESAIERKNRAYELRKQGKTYRQIGKEIGVSHVVAFDYVKEIYDEHAAENKKAGKELVELDLGRLDDLLKVLYPMALGGGPDAVAAMDRIIKINERRAKIFGHDAAAKTENVHRFDLAERIKSARDRARE